MESHLLQMRGLKQDRQSNTYKLIWSHLLQMRGLKLKCKNDRSFRTRRIFYRCVD